MTQYIATAEALSISCMGGKKRQQKNKTNKQTNINKNPCDAILQRCTWKLVGGTGMGVEKNKKSAASKTPPPQRPRFYFQKKKKNNNIN